AFAEVAEIATALARAGVITEPARKILEFRTAGRERVHGVGFQTRARQRRVGRRHRHDDLLEDHGRGALAQALAIVGEVAHHLRLGDWRRTARLLLARHVCLDQSLPTNLLLELRAELHHCEPARAQRSLELGRTAKCPLSTLHFLLHRTIDCALVHANRRVTRCGLQDDELIDAALEQLPAQPLERGSLRWWLLRLRDRAENVFLDVVVQDDAVTDDRHHEPDALLLLCMRRERDEHERDSSGEYRYECANCRHPGSVENGNGRHRPAVPASVISLPPERVPAHGCGVGESGSGCGVPGCCCGSGGTAGRAASTRCTTTGNARSRTSPPYTERSAYESGPSESTFC